MASNKIIFYCNIHKKSFIDLIMTNVNVYSSSLMEGHEKKYKTLVSFERQENFCCTLENSIFAQKKR